MALSRPIKSFVVAKRIENGRVSESLPWNPAWSNLQVSLQNLHIKLANDCAAMVSINFKPHSTSHSCGDLGLMNAYYKDMRNHNVTTMHLAKVIYLVWCWDLASYTNFV
jgi:hypothetical protein